MTTYISEEPRRKSIDGLLLLNKPAGITSNQALQKVKKLLKVRKAGHTGTLDPAATGMLPLCFGEATKVCAYLLDADKVYRVTARLGMATDTGDIDGRETVTAQIPTLNRYDWRKLLIEFCGDIEQVPPMYSALKQGGKRLYALARKGKIVKRQPRKVRIYDINLLEVSGQRLVFRVHCSKGTYIRTLVEDIAKAAGTVAHIANLHRESVGNFRTEDMVDLLNIERFAGSSPEVFYEYLLPTDEALVGWPKREINEDAAAGFTAGQAVPVDI